MKKLSGADWVREFPGSSSTAALSMQFCPGVERFIKALKKSGRQCEYFCYAPASRKSLSYALGMDAFQ